MFIYLEKMADEEKDKITVRSYPKLTDSDGKLQIHGKLENDEKQIIALQKIKSDTRFDYWQGIIPLLVEEYLIHGEHGRIVSRIGSWIKR